MSDVEFILLSTVGSLFLSHSLCRLFSMNLMYFIKHFEGGVSSRYIASQGVIIM